MFYIACTRFNNTTYDENINYRSKHNENVISPNIPINSSDTPYGINQQRLEIRGY